MLDPENNVVFSVSRSDLLYSFEESLGQIFLFRDADDEELRPEEGTRRVELEGFDFTRECSPRIVVRPIEFLSKEITDLDVKLLRVYVTLEDIGLHSRKVVAEFDADSVSDDLVLDLDLSENSEMSFSRGFQVRCFITLKKDRARGSASIWDKSQVIYSRTFAVRTSDDEALFEISWRNFANEADRRDVFYYVDWSDTDVSGSVATDCFEVVANDAVRAQFKRLENNSHFGHFAIRLMAQDILSELVSVCLRYATLDRDPEPDSLHDKVKALFDRQEIGFDEYARRAQSNDAIDRLNVEADVKRLVQRLNTIGTELGGVKFGGYRN